MKKNNKKIDISILIPAYNEERHIINTIKKIYLANIYFKKKIEIIVIDDHSYDQTSLLVKKFINSNKDKKIFLFRNKRNLGVSYGFAKALKFSNGTYFRMVCGDDIDEVHTHKLIFKNLKKFDIINPVYRNVKGKPFGREIISKLFTFIVNFFSTKKLNYYNGTVAYNSKMLKKLTDYGQGFGFQAYITCQLLKKKCTVFEINCNAKHRIKSNAINLKNLYLAFILILKLIKLSLFNK